MAFVWNSQIPFNLADPAGILFFGNAFPLAHQAFESYVETSGFKWKNWFDNSKWATPIIETSARYFKPIRAGSQIAVSLSVVDLREGSYELRCDFTQGPELCIRLKIVQCFVDRPGFKKVKMPKEAFELLEKLKDR
jgi:acyl-CoA thioesterase FadM